MRFELFLTRLPRAPDARVKAALSDLPKGVSSGVVLKSLETRQVPTVAVAWHDDKRVMNEIMDTLAELGAETRLLDHANPLLRIGTFFAERIRGRRYLDEDDEDDAPLVRLGKTRDAPGAGEVLARHALRCALHILLVDVLLLWFIGLRVGLSALDSARQLGAQLAACSVGVASAYIAAHSLKALRSGRIARSQAVVLLVGCAVPTLLAPFYLGPGFAGHEQAARIARPPSYPYAGLLSELQRRKLAAEIAGITHVDDESYGSDEREAAPGEDALLCAERDPTWVALACEGGPAWEVARACLPALDAPRALPRAEPAKSAPMNEPPPARAIPPIKQEPSVTFALVDVMWLMASCLFILGGVMLYERRRAAASAPREEPSAGEAALRAELALLREQLSRAEAAQAPNAPESQQTVKLARELELARNALLSSEAAIAEMRQKLGAASESQRRLQAELGERAQAEVQQEARAAKAESELAELRTVLARQRAANDRGPITPTPSAEARASDATVPIRVQSAEASSSYSVSSGQEERIVLPKRRR